MKRGKRATAYRVPRHWVPRHPKKRRKRAIQYHVRATEYRERAAQYRNYIFYKRRNKRDPG